MKSLASLKVCVCIHVTGCLTGGVQVKFYYEIGETVRFSCTGGAKLAGPPLLKCLDSGHWSGGVPRCRHL